MCRLVKTQMSAAISSERCTMSRAPEPGDREQRARGGEGVVAAGADRHDAVVGLDQLARAAQEEAVLQVGHDQQRLEPAEDPVAPPVLGQLDRGAREVGRDSGRASPRTSRTA